MNQFIPWSDHHKSPGWIVQPNGCEIWTGQRNNNGMGRIEVKRKKLAVHRIRYEEKYGKLPSGAKLTNECGDVLCGNPDHWRMLKEREAPPTTIVDRHNEQIDPDVQQWIVDQIAVWQMPTVKQAAMAYLEASRRLKQGGKYDGPKADEIISEISKDAVEHGLLVDAMLVIAERMTEQPVQVAA